MRKSALSLALMLAATPLLGAPPPLTVVAPPALESVAQRLRALTRDDFEAVVRLTGVREFGPPIRVTLAANGSELARHAPTWVSGYALTPVDEIVLFPGRVPSYPDRNLDGLIHHEVAHVLIARAAGDRPVPRWFNEGLATVAGREWGIEDRARYAIALIGPGPHTLAEVDTVLARGSGNVSRAYALSAALVRSLLQRYGPDTAAEILALVGRGMVFPDAFKAITGKTAAAFGEGFFGREALWNTWVPFLTSSGVLWLAITFLALYATKRRRERDEAQRAAWALQERAEDETLRQWRPDPGADEDPMRLN